jgi:ribosomal-protein-alanine N-acetyltransferase
MKASAMKIEIKLRKLMLADVDEEYCSWYLNGDGHLQYFTGSGREFSKNVLIEDFEKGESSGSHYYYVIEVADGTRIGNVKIGPIDIRNRNSDLVCLIGDRSYLGKGIASQAILLANQIAFETHNIRRLQGGMHSPNIPSIKAYTNAGWIIEATMRGFYLIDGAPVDRVCVACLNPKYFPVSSY